MILNFFRRIVVFIKYVFTKKYKESYSQSGEDILIDAALRRFNIATPSYLDIGANHPIFKNNTYLFYKRGATGVCIEPDPDVFRVLKRTRPRDVCLQIGIGGEDERKAATIYDPIFVKDFYVMKSRQLNTFLKEEAEKYVNEGNFGVQRIENIIKIPLIPITLLLSAYFPNGIDAVSLDAEGYDLAILKAMDLKRYRPKVICVETLMYEGAGKLRKEEDISDYLLGTGYFLYADTHTNSIFVDKTAWEALNHRF